MFGNNPIRPPVTGDGATLSVQEIFPTLQGEGPLSGVPAVFLRLGGCNLACGFCDTEFESFREMVCDEVIAQVKREAGENITLVVITGGEPLRQPLRLLTDRLLAEGFTIQIETNGTLYQALDERVQIVCSPKTTTGRYARVREDLLPRITAFKFILSAHDPVYGAVGDVGQGDYGIPVYVQPMDEQDALKNSENLAWARDTALREGYRLSLQIHKMLGMR